MPPIPKVARNKYPVKKASDVAVPPVSSVWSPETNTGFSKNKLFNIPIEKNITPSKQALR